MFPAPHIPLAASDACLIIAFPCGYFRNEVNEVESTFFWLVEVLVSIKQDKLQKSLRKVEIGSGFCNDFNRISAMGCGTIKLPEKLHAVTSTGPYC